MIGQTTPQVTTITTLTQNNAWFEPSVNIGILATTALAKPSKVV